MLKFSGTMLSVCVNVCVSIASIYSRKTHATIVYSCSLCRRKLRAEHVAFDVGTNTMRILSLWEIQLDSYPYVVAF